MIYFLPMRPRVILIGYDGVDALDLFGPAEVFSAACERARAPLYEVIIASADRRAIRVTCGATVVARNLLKLRPRPSDTVLVAGGDDRAIETASAIGTVPMKLRWRRPSMVVQLK